MSVDNVQIVRRGYEAINAGDLETAFALFDPNAEIRPGQDLPNLDFEEVYYGPQGFVQFLSRINEAWEEPRWEPEEYLAAGDQVLVFIRMTMKGRGSGIPMEQKIGHLCTLRDGKLVRHLTYWDRAKALEAAGLTDRGSPDESSSG